VLLFQYSLFISFEYSQPLAIPVFLNFAFRSQGACPSIARKIESQSIRTRLAFIDS
uniref:Uncharacterized protein n=1 Tax=Amphimedon queenslandica TaxID=400682 RepID=A0A1X7UWJ4_AMPQE